MIKILPRPLLALWLIVISLALTAGFWLSRLIPKTSPPSPVANGQVIPIESITQKEDLKVGKIYGNVATNFKDSATGVIERGSINGEGTHILNRPGGLSQRASLTSSVLDLDLFIGRQVEVRGETNASTKTGWLLDVGMVKVLQ